MSKTLSKNEFRILVSLAKRVLWQDKAVKRELQSFGVNITPANFYSDIPLVQDVEDSFEYRDEAAGTPPYLHPGMYDPQRMAAFLSTLDAHADEFDPPLEGDIDAPEGFFWRNPAFSRLDAMAYYCVLRALKPQRVVEVGAGYSSLVADLALRRNGSGELVIVEPYPKPFLSALPTLAELIEQPVQHVPVDKLVALVESAQVWFIDSTHTVKIGSDCLYLYLKVMSRIRTKVLCHSHDIYLPYAMPPSQPLNRNVFWTEHYLLQAYLLDNPKAKVMFGSYLLHRTDPGACQRFLRNRIEPGGASFWYELNG